MGPESLVTTYEPVRAPPRRVRYDPLGDDRFERVEQVWNGCRWRTTGRETVTLVEHGCPEPAANHTAFSGP